MFLDISFKPPTANLIADKIVSGANYFVSGITWGTSKTKNLIQNVGSRFKKNSPNQSREDTAIDPKVIENLRKIRKASEAASYFTGACASAIASGTQYLGQSLAPHVVNNGAHIVSYFTGSSVDSSKSTVDGVLTLASAGIESFYTMYEGIVDNAVTIGKAIASETVGIIDNKYGSQIAEATNEALLTASNATNAVMNARQLRPKSLVKKTVKEAVINIRPNAQINSDFGESETTDTKIKST